MEKLVKFDVNIKQSKGKFFEINYCFYEGLMIIKNVYITKFVYLFPLGIRENLCKVSHDKILLFSSWILVFRFN